MAGMCFCHVLLCFMGIPWMSDEIPRRFNSGIDTCWGFGDDINRSQILNLRMECLRIPGFVPQSNGRRQRRACAFPTVWIVVSQGSREILSGNLFPVPERWPGNGIRG